jgi:hypothetical protein
MTRMLRAAAFVALVTLAFGTTACTDLTGPRGECDQAQGSNTCGQAQGSNT